MTDRLDVTKVIRGVAVNEREACAAIADIWANTKPDYKKSTNPAMANIIATVTSETAKKIAEAIRARGQ